MNRLICLAFVIAACTSSGHRDPTLEVVALEILAPTCGQVQCHSSSTKTEGYAFDTLDGAKAALKRLVNGTNGGQLLEVLETTGGKRMPPDYPLDTQDIDLIKAWVAAGSQGLE
ncbi:MAG TPA: hypothetical protein VGC41_15855, partial [Kofleriaceae bacterium]